MNRNVEKLLPRALEASEIYLMSNRENLIAFKEYDGYAANLGAAIRRSGLLPALSFYTDVHKMKDNNKPYRNRLLVAILYTLEEALPDDREDQGRELLKRVVQAGYGANVFDNTDRTIRGAQPTNSEAIADWRKRINSASVAIKLALRSYQHTTVDQDQN